MSIADSVSPSVPGPDPQAWLGRTEQARDTVTPQLAERLAATISSSRGPLQAGDELPRAWYAVLFPRVVAREKIGVDGHPALGDFLPPVPLPKRMFAGKRIEFQAPIRIGDVLERTSEIVAINPKRGASGALVFVTVRHTIRNESGPVVVEEQDVVYREAASPAKGAASKQAPAATAAKSQCGGASSESRRISAGIVADPVMVFRYSALCFNGHRIHYDYPYATQVEGYPNLVVNGGLSTLCAVEHLHDAWGGELQSLATRNTAPLFVDERFWVESAPAQEPGGVPGSVDFNVVKAGGLVAVSGRAVLRGAGQ